MSTQSGKRRSCLGRAAAIAFVGLTLLCVAALGLSALGNRNLPEGPAVLDRLDPLDKARLQETLHLKQELGEAVWPGWGQSEIPILIWNNQYSFLVGVAEPPAGWEVVPGDDFEGQPYYRKPTEDPQNFAVRVGDQWAASLGTKWEADNFLISNFRQMMPGPLKPLFPYWILIQPSEVQMSGVLHEAFHVFQAHIAPEHLKTAEQAHGADDNYWAVDANMHAAWQNEIDALLKALSATDRQAMTGAAQEFLTLRLTRRVEYQLDSTLIDFEREIEWEEGLAKYVELVIWREAANTPAYTPLADLNTDPDFKKYATFNQRWAQELDQTKRQATQDGEGRFYYTGMVQAVLLDQLMPKWKTRILSEQLTPEDLLREATQWP